MVQSSTLPTLYDNRTFFGFPTFEAYSPKVPKAAIFGLPSSLGTPNSGSENGPYFIRRLSKQYNSRFEGKGKIIDLRHSRTNFEGFVDAGDLHPAESDLDHYCGMVENLVAQFPVETIPIAIGGDHALSYPLVKTIHQRTSGIDMVVIFDHHLDVQCWGDEVDGLFHTTVASQISHELGPGKVVHIGVDPIQEVEDGWEEKLFPALKEIGHQFPLFSNSIQSLETLLAVIGEGKRLYISFDLDVLQASEMQSTGYPSWLGMSYQEVLKIFDAIAENNTIVGCDIVEFAASREDLNKTVIADAGRAAALLTHVLGTISRQ